MSAVLVKVAKKIKEIKSTEHKLEHDAEASSSVGLSQPIIPLSLTSISSATGSTSGAANQPRMDKKKKSAKKVVQPKEESETKDIKEQQQNYKVSEAEVIIDSQKVHLKGLKEINVILGRNGCGKSRILRAFANKLRINRDIVCYIPPERGERLRGFRDDSSVPADMPANLEENEDMDFRKKTLTNFTIKAEYRIKFEGIRGNHVSYYLNIINPILENIEVSIEQTPNNKEEIIINYYMKGTHTKIFPHQLSSGENELISLWMEFLRFLDSEGNACGNKFLLLDEPDVHLHPDAQCKIAELIFNMTHDFNSRPVEYRFQVILVTHSTSILSSLSGKPGVSVCFMKKSTDLEFISIENDSHSTANHVILKSILPIFGAHPLTQIFNEKPILIAEGEDEERIWQQAVRSSNGKLKVYPCATGGEGDMFLYEKLAAQIIGSIYDEPKAYSLRDNAYHHL